MSANPPDTLKSDANAIFTALQGIAQEQLSKAGSLMPCGAFVRLSGSCELHMVADSAARTQQELETVLLAALSSLVTTGKVRAIGWCLDVRTTLPRTGESTDAILIVMEHRAGEAIHCFTPYRKGWWGKVTYGTPFSAPASMRLFIAT